MRKLSPSDCSPALNELKLMLRPAICLSSLCFALSSSSSMVVYKSTVKFARDNSQWPTLCLRDAVHVKITLPIDDASSAILVAVVVLVLLNLYFYSAHDLNFRDRLFAIYFVRFILFINLSFYIFSDIISLYPQKYIKSAFGCSKYDPRSFNSVRLLREIEMRIDFLSRFREFTASLLANYIATCVECNVWEWIPPQSTLMSVSSGKVNTLKSRFNLSSALLPFLPCLVFYFPRAKWSYFLRATFRVNLSKFTCWHFYKT